MMRKSTPNQRTAGTAAVIALTVALVAGCAAPRTNAVVRSPELPNYRVDGFRVEEPVDLYIEPRIVQLRQEVRPMSATASFDPITVNTGAALDDALLAVTRQYFAKATKVDFEREAPTVRYSLLSYSPKIAVEDGLLSTALNVSARVTLRLEFVAAGGERMLDETAIGTSHVSDTNITTGSGLGDAARLIEVATREAIADAMYEVSRILGANSAELSRIARYRPDAEAVAREEVEDVVMHVKTRRNDES